MATETVAPTRWLADEWENRCGYASAVLSGIVPDRSHLDSGGYHVSIEDLIRYGNRGDYSNQGSLDKAPPVTAAGKRLGAAVDMSMSKADMVKLYGRAMRVYNNRSDPRRRWLNAINVWDGMAGHAPRRLNFQKNTNTTASTDHTWHSHEDQPRAYVDVYRNEAEAWIAARAFISMVKGETVDHWLTSIGDDDVSASDFFNYTIANPLIHGSPGVEFYKFVTTINESAYQAKLNSADAKAEATKARLTAEATLAAVQGLDTAAVLARVDDIAAAEQQRDADAAAERANLAGKFDQLTALVQQAESGQLTAEQVLAKLRDLLPADTSGS